MRITRIVITTQARERPKTGDRRITKKHGLQIRIPERHNGMHVVAHGRPCYVWCKPADLPALYRYLLSDAERKLFFPPEAP
jgi:hypothetical protein